MDVFRSQVFRILASLAFLTVASLSAAQPKGLVVLIPGFGSGLLRKIPAHGLPTHSVSPYFSEAVSSSFIHFGYDVLAVRDLKSAGDINENSDRVIAQIQLHLTSQKLNTPITLVGHSMGGLIALRVAEKVGEDIAIQRVIAVSTPLKGSIVADTVLGSRLSRRIFNHAVRLFADFIDLRALPELTTEHVAKFVSGLQLPHKLKIQAFAGSQPENRVFGTSWDAPIQSPLYLPLSRMIGENSDGVVETSSSLPDDLFVQSAQGEIPIQSQPLIAPLDHEELHMDYRNIADIFQTDNTQYVLDHQTRFYTRMAECFEQDLDFCE